MGAKTPPQPDFGAQAREQGVANKATAVATSKLNNPNVYTPYGNQTIEYNPQGSFDTAGYDRAMSDYTTNLNQYNQQVGANNNQNTGRTQNGGRGSNEGNAGSLIAPIAPERSVFENGNQDEIPTVTQTLSPENQALYEQELRVNAGLGDIAEGGIGRVDQLLGTPFDNSQVRDRAMSGQQGWDNAYNAQIERNQPFQERARDRRTNQLSNQGIYAGSEAFAEAMRDISRGENDFNLGAQANATAQQQAQFGMDTQGRQNDLQEESFLRQLPLNELNALRSGNQIQSPQFQAFQGSQIAPPPLFQAGQAQYQADLNKANASNGAMAGLTNGLFGLGGSGLMAWSDRRLKSNIKRIGTHPLGIGIYEYDIFNRHDIGVMADEVAQIKPELVATMPNGYKAVNYAGL